MVLLTGGTFPVYPGLPYGFYSHVEPVVGIYTNRSFDDMDWYNDDVLVHSTGAWMNSIYRNYRTFESLPDNLNFTGNCRREVAHSSYMGYGCIYDQYGFGWAIQGVEDAREGLELSLDVDRPDEPDTCRGQAPVQLQGTVTVTGLVSGTRYVIHRWDSVEAAFDYALSQQHRFTAGDATYTYEDLLGITSNGVAYYRCVADAEAAVVEV